MSRILVLPTVQKGLLPNMADTLTANQAIPRGGALISKNGAFRLAFQTDGNLVVYNKQNQAIWSASLAGKGGVRAVMQSDGNFVIYNASNQPVFDTHTNGNPGAKLVMQTDGNAVIYNRANRPIWESRTWGGSYHKESHNVFSDVASTFASTAKGIASVSKDVVTSPVWKVAAGAAAFIPGIGVPLSAGMIGAAAIGKATSAKDGIMAAAKGGLDVAGAAGFDIGTGLALGAQGMTGSALETVRSMVPAGSARAGFDAALSLHVGRTTGAQAPPNMPNNAKAAFYATHGLQAVKAPPAMKKEVVSRLTQTPGSAAGVHLAVTQLNPDETWLQWIVSQVKKGARHVFS